MIHIGKVDGMLLDRETFFCLQSMGFSIPIQKRSGRSWARINIRVVIWTYIKRLLFTIHVKTPNFFLNLSCILTQSMIGYILIFSENFRRVIG
jgi:hypothetical protein